MGKVDKENQTKQCTKCLIVKPLTEFHKLKNWYQPKCKSCRKEYQDKEDIKARKVAYDKIRVEQTYDIRKLISRRKRVKLYGLTLEEYEEKLLAQNNCCMICGRDNNYTATNFHIDHNHETGQVRDLLCFKCNVGLGNFGDNIELLEKALEYLKKWNK